MHITRFVFMCAVKNMKVDYVECRVGAPATCRLTVCNESATVHVTS